MRLKLFFLLTLMAVLPALAQQVGLYGVVVDSRSGQPVSGATVLLDQAAHPPLVFDHHENASMLDLLNTGQIDLIIGHEAQGDIDTHNLAVVPLTAARFCAVVNNDNPLAKLESVRADDLRDQVLLKFVDPYAGHGWRNIEEYLARHGIEPRVRSVMGRVTSYQATPVDNTVFIQTSNMRNLKFMNDTGRYVVVPFADDDAFFYLECIFKRSEEERLRFLVDTLVESRDIVVKHRERQA